MAVLHNDLTLISYNCEYADNVRLPCLQNLFERCDFLLLQEHGLYQSKLGWLSAVGENIGEHGVKVGIHGVSAMDESKPLRGRPNGGAVILWHEALTGIVTPIAWDSKRFCAVKYNTGNLNILIICVYMPCDDWRPDCNLVEFNDILNEICTLSVNVEADCICIGGDLNTDLGRNTYQTNSLKSFITNQDIFCCASNDMCNIKYTYKSKINGTKTFIDHFLVSDNLGCNLSQFRVIDDINNTSDHVPIIGKFNIDISYNNISDNIFSINRPAWNLASEFDIESYMTLLDMYLLEIPLPLDLINCNDNMCKYHQTAIATFHDNIINALIMASEETVPTRRPRPKPKTVVGWNDHVKHFFKTALFWHKIWVENGRPDDDDNILANIRRTTRAEYHKARKNAIRYQGLITSEKLADSLADDPVNLFWDKVKRTRPNVSKIPSSVDGIHDNKDIAELFKGKFNDLFNCVSYNEDEMSLLHKDINCRIKNESMPQNNSNTLLIGPNLVEKGISNLKSNKNDGNNTLTSENLIHSTNILFGHLSLLFSAMLRHGCSPEGMLLGTMVPLPKGRWNDYSKSKNFRALTISSLLGKVLDNIILNLECNNLLTNELQFSFKSDSSTTMCTTMIRETISYFVNKGSNVYGLVLDATKAFDRINYCKLFRILLKRNIDPLICRLLLSMYTNQKLRVKWANEFSNEFSVTNGVKQGGVISPLLYCVYIDGLISELIASEVGCYMGRVYAGIFMFADDLKLLAPSVQALHIMLNVCLRYAAKYDVQFNDKSQLIIFKANEDNIPTPEVFINGTKLKAVSSVNHLGHILHDNIFYNDASKCVNDFYGQLNSFLSDFRHLGSVMRNYLFFKYCNAFYGSQFLPVYCKDVMNELAVAWRIGLRKVWRIPWTTHNNILPVLAGVMPPNLFFEKRAINFSNKLLNSKNKTVKTITGMAIHGVHSILGQNIKHLLYRYNLNINEVSKCWERQCNEQVELTRLCYQIKELCILRDSPCSWILSRPEAQAIIEFLCTE